VVLQYPPKWCIQNLILVPRMFFTGSMIGPRNPLSPDARRARSQQGTSIKSKRYCADPMVMTEHLASRTHERLIARINRKDWWHCLPRDPKAYHKRGMFLSSTYALAEFWRPPLDQPVHICVRNPLVGDEAAIEMELIGMCGGHDGMGMRARFALDAKLKRAAIKAGYDAIVLMSESGYEYYLGTGRIPLSLELNIFSSKTIRVPHPVLAEEWGPARIMPRHLSATLPTNRQTRRGRCD
jgi:hypothetical protein